jgi:vacuolar protein sorting-associated protein VTA1
MAAGKVPDVLRSIQPYVSIYKQFRARDPVVSYFAGMHAVKEGIRSSGKDATAKVYLGSFLDELEQLKHSMDSEEVTNEVVGQARVEEVGLKLFNSADKQDRAGKFDKNVVKSFFTSHYMLLIVKGLGGLTEEVEAKQRYARWKAVEIDRCLKNGIPPTPGPPGEGGGELSEQTVSPFPEEQLQPSARPTPKPRSLPPEPGPHGLRGSDQ